MGIVFCYMSLLTLLLHSYLRPSAPSLPRFFLQEPVWSVSLHYFTTLTSAPTLAPPTRPGWPGCPPPNALPSDAPLPKPYYASGGRVTLGVPPPVVLRPSSQTFAARKRAPLLNGAPGPPRSTPPHGSFRALLANAWTSSWPNMRCKPAANTMLYEAVLLPDWPAQFCLLIFYWTLLRSFFVTFP